MPRDRRAQMLLVAALALAVAFVALALVLNAVVFTENLATRNHDRTDDALGYEGAVESGTAGLLAAANDDDSTDYGAITDSVAARLARWDANATRLSTAGGSVTAASLAGVQNGTQILQAQRGNFTDAADNSDWTAASGVNETRRFRVRADPNATTDPFTVTVTDGTASWRVEVAENATDAGNTTVTVSRNGSTVLTESRATETVELDLTEGLLNGSAIPGWTWAAGVSAPYDVAVENGGNATGKYVLFVDKPRVPLLDALPRGTYHPRWRTDSPTTVPAVYRATVALTLRNDRVTYRSTVGLSPESEPGGEDYAVDQTVPPRPPGVVIRDPDAGRLLYLTEDETQVLDADAVDVIGPLRTDLDGDARLELPYVNGTGALKLVDTANRSQTWRTASAPNPPRTSPSRLAAHPDPAGGVLYADASGNNVYAARNDTGPSVRRHNSGNGVSAVAGVADVDGDGSDELVFGDGSQQLRYRDDDGTEQNINNGGYGQNNGAGLGSPADFDGDGTARVPFVDGSNNLKLVDAAGNVETIVAAGDTTVSKAPVAVDDWDRDGDLEIVFVSGGELWYADDIAAGGTAVQITDDLDGDGDPGVDADPGVGVA
jgi:hypothetical protein